jgi:transmembrane sensor
MENEQLKTLLKKYELGECTGEEVALIENWYNAASAVESDPVSMEHLSKANANIWGKVLGRTDLANVAALAAENVDTSELKTTVKFWPRIAGVAAAVAAIAFGVWFYTYEVASSRKAPRNDVAYANDVAPGKNTATLTLPNGKTINLSDAKTGVVVGTDKLAYNDGTVVDPLTGSSLRGDTTKQPHTSDEIAASQRAPRNDTETSSAQAMMLTAATPRGGQYQITLPDGTRVWLNADSKISFPAQFFGKERRILLVSGEAYFEVAKVMAPATGEVAAARSGRPRNDVRVPFIVESKGQEVEVLGTHFNISAYSDERSTKTTLLEGSVRVSSLRAPAPSLGEPDPSLRGGTTRQSHDEVAASRRAPRNDDRNNDGRGGKSEVLKPNQQAVLTANANQFKIQQVDVNDVIDWKNGDFIFKEESLGQIMKRVARWYSVTVVYEKGVAIEQTFGGKVSRSKPVSAVLNSMQATGKIRFKIEDKQITVYNNP